MSTLAAPDGAPDGALAAVAWPALAADVARTADPAAAAAVPWHLQRRSPLFGEAHVELVVCATLAGRTRVRELVTAHAAGVDPAPVGRWLYRTCRSAFRLTAHRDLPTPRPLLLRGTPGPVWVHRDLPGLPCLGVALDHALADRPIVVRAVDLPPGVGGCTWRQPVPVTWRVRDEDTRADATLVDIDPGGADLGRVWLHELGHVLDPRPADRSTEDDEDRADALAALMWRHRPRSLEQLHSLAAPVPAAAPRPVDRPAPTPAAAAVAVGADLPLPGIDSLLALASLPLTAA